MTRIISPVQQENWDPMDKDPGPRFSPSGLSRTYLNLEEILGWSIDLVEGLLASIGQTGHGLHDGSWKSRIGR